MHTSKLLSYISPFLSHMCRINLYTTANINHKILTGETTDQEQWKGWEYMFAAGMLRHVFYWEWWQSEYQQSRSEIKNNNKRMVCWEDVCHVCHWDVHASIEVFFVGFAGVVAECQQSRSEIKNKQTKKNGLLGRCVTCLLLGCTCLHWSVLCRVCRNGVSSQDQRSRTKKRTVCRGDAYHICHWDAHMLTLKCVLWGFFRHGGRMSAGEITDQKQRKGHEDPALKVGLRPRFVAFFFPCILGGGVGGGARSKSQGKWLTWFACTCVGLGFDLIFYVWVLLHACVVLVHCHLCWFLCLVVSLCLYWTALLACNKKKRFSQNIVQQKIIIRNRIMFTFRGPLVFWNRLVLDFASAALSADCTRNRWKSKKRRYARNVNCRWAQRGAQRRFEPTTTARIASQTTGGLPPCTMCHNFCLVKIPWTIWFAP